MQVGKTDRERNVSAQSYISWEDLTPLDRR